MPVRSRLGYHGALTEAGLDTPPAFVDDVDSGQSPDHQQRNHDKADDAIQVAGTARDARNFTLAATAE